TSSTSVLVRNIAPANVGLALNPNSINEGESTVLSGSFTDPGRLDSHIVDIHWGDGGESIVPLAAGQLTFAGISHQYLDNPSGQPHGSYSIVAIVLDKDLVGSGS